jgi:hypothetical protein
MFPNPPDHPTEFYMKTISLLLTALLLPLGAAAQQPPQAPRLPQPPSQQTGPVLVIQMDKDGDKKISQKEFLKAAEDRAVKQFKRLDSNSDGYITIEEENNARDQAMEMLRKQMEAGRSPAAPQTK